MGDDGHDVRLHVTERIAPDEEPDMDGALVSTDPLGVQERETDRLRSTDEEVGMTDEDVEPPLVRELHRASEPGTGEELGHAGETEPARGRFRRIRQDPSG